jgi:hypothetical protein
MTAPAVLEWILGIPIFLMGCFIGATGRRLRGFPPPPAEGWSVRALGVFYVVAGAWFSFHIWPFDATWESVLVMYGAVALTAVVVVVRRGRRPGSSRL